MTAMSLFAIGAHDLGLEFALVGKRDGDAARAIHDVIVGNDVAVLRHDHAGSHSRFSLLGDLRLSAELAVAELAVAAALVIALAIIGAFAELVIEAVAEKLTEQLIVWQFVRQLLKFRGNFGDFR